MVEDQRDGEIREGLGAPLLKVLTARRGMPTIVRMASGAEEVISDGTGWGRDIGDVWEHVVAERHPRGQTGPVFFYMSEVECLIDPETREVLAAQVPAPGET